jgi:hypothetical protein
VTETAFELRTALVAAAMLAGLVAFVELGRWLGKRRRALGAGGEEAEGAAIDAAVFALFGLLVAFSFSGALDRFEHRRTLIVEEANAITTAYHRLELLPAGARPPLRALLRQYVESRLAFYRKMSDDREAAAERERALALKDLIWRQAIEAGRGDGNAAVLGLVGSGLNAMFDVEVERVAATQRHPPAAIYGLLFAVGFASAFLAGYGTAGRPRNWSRVIVFSASTALAVFVIVNLEYPRIGLIRLGVADQPLFEVLERMR